MRKARGDNGAVDMMTVRPHAGAGFKPALSNWGGASTGFCSLFASIANDPAALGDPYAGKSLPKDAGFETALPRVTIVASCPTEALLAGPPEASRRYLTHLPAADTVSRDASLLHIGTGHDDCA